MTVLIVQLLDVNGKTKNALGMNFIQTKKSICKLMIFSNMELSVKIIWICAKKMSMMKIVLNWVGIITGDIYLWIIFVFGPFNLTKALMAFKKYIQTPKEILISQVAVQFTKDVVKNWKRLLPSILKNVQIMMKKTPNALNIWMIMILYMKRK